MQQTYVILFTSSGTKDALFPHKSDELESKTFSPRQSPVQRFRTFLLEAPPAPTIAGG